VKVVAAANIVIDQLSSRFLLFFVFVFVFVVEKKLGSLVSFTTQDDREKVVHNQASKQAHIEKYNFFFKSRKHIKKYSSTHTLSCTQ
jgi:hypothetical protein